METCCEPLIIVANNVAQYWDTIINEGYRSEVKQNKVFSSGNSRVEWPNSKHNTFPSKAIHLAPFSKTTPGGIDWEDLDTFYKYGFFVLGVAFSLGIKLRWGGDWSMDGITTDQTFNDLIHFEFVRYL